MSDPEKNPLTRKDSSDSGDEANVPTDQGASSRVCPVIEETPVTEASTSSPAEMEGAVGGEDPSNSLSGAPQQSCLSPNLNPGSDAAADSGKSSPKRSPVLKIIKDTVKGIYHKISPTKTSPKKNPKEKKQESPTKRGKSETRDIKSLPPSRTGFQPFCAQYYDVKSIKSVEETDYTEMGESVSPCEVSSIPPDSLRTSPLTEDSDNEGSPKKVKKFYLKKDSDKDYDDDKDKAA